MHTALFVIAKLSPQNSPLSFCLPCLARLLQILGITSTAQKRRKPMRELAPYPMRLTFPSERGKTAVFVGSVGQEEERPSLRDCWWIITNRFWLIAVFLCGTVLATAILLVLMPPTYTAEVTLLIERKPPRVLDMYEASAALFVPDDYGFYQTQYELLKSRALAVQVIRELQLHPQHLRGEGAGILEGVKLY